MTVPELELARVDEHLYTASRDGQVVARSRVEVGPGVWEIFSTVVEPAFEGQGIAGRLTAFVLDAAEQAGVRVVPSCWYVDRFMRHTAPRYDHLRTGPQEPVADDVCLLGPVVVHPSAPAEGEAGR